MKVVLAIFGLAVLAISVNGADVCESSLDGYAYPKPDSCETFYLCTNKTAEERKCAFGLHFNPKKFYCQKPDVAGCKSSGGSADCSTSIDGETFPKPGDCGKFYVCTGKLPVEKNCKAGLHYNPIKKHCEDPALAGCDSSGGSGDCSSSIDGETFPKPGDCGKFYLCTGKLPVEKNCKAGLHYNAVKKYCEDPALAGCDSSGGSGDCSTSIDGETFPKPGDCGKFYLCTGKLPVEKNCKAGLHYNPIKKYCEDPALAGCGTKPPPITTTKVPPTGPTNSPSNWCKGEPLGKLIPYPGDCTKFIQCIGGGVVKECKPPLHFNAKAQVCDWPESANCPWQ